MPLKFITHIWIHVSWIFVLSMCNKWLKTFGFAHILNYFMIEIKLNLNISFLVILLQNGIVFEHFEWESIESFVELRQLIEIRFFDKVLGLLKLVIADKCEIVINYANNSREITCLRGLVWLIDLSRVFFTVWNLLDEANKLPSKIILHFILPSASFICILYIIVEIFLSENVKNFIVFIVESVVKIISKSWDACQKFNIHPCWFLWFNYGFGTDGTLLL